MAKRSAVPEAFGQNSAGSEDPRTARFSRISYNGRSIPRYELKEFELLETTYRSKDVIPTLISLGPIKKTGIPTGFEYISRTTEVLIRHVNGRLIARFSPTFAFQRWFRQMTSSRAVVDRGGRINWNRDTVIEVSFRDCVLTDEALRESLESELQYFPDLRRLDLTGTKVTDAGIECLSVLSRQVEVLASRTAVNQEAIERLNQDRERKHRQGRFGFLES